MHRAILAFAPAVRSLAAAGLLVAVSAGTLAAQTAAAKTTAAKSAAALHWGPAPAVFPAGARMAVVSGDPGAAGPFVVRLQFPNGYRIAPHSHPTDENVTVRSGVLTVGMGDTIALAKGNRMTPGKSGKIAANMHHWAVARGRTVIQISAMGPFQMTYVNPADDPQRTVGAR